VNDAMWLADLLAHGLVAAAFVPPSHIQEVRDLSRTRKQLTREVIQHTNRIQKRRSRTRTQARVGDQRCPRKSGRALLEAIIGGETNPERLVELCSGRSRPPETNSSRRCAGVSPRTTASSSSSTLPRWNQ